MVPKWNHLEFAMATITVKNIPDELYAQLKKVAKANQRSINREVIYAIRRAVVVQPLDVDEWLKETREIRERTGKYILTDEEIEQAINTGRP